MRLLQTTDEVRHLVYTNDGAGLVTAEGDRDGIRTFNFWNLPDGRRMDSDRVAGRPKQAAFAATASGILIAFSAGPRVQLVKLAGAVFEPIPRPLETDLSENSAIALATNGGGLAIGSIDRVSHRTTIEIHPLGKAGATQRFFTLTDVHHLAFHPNRSFLVSAGWGQYTIWDFERRESFRVGSERNLGPIAFSPDGFRLVIAAGNRCTIWDETHDKIIQTIVLKSDNPIEAIAFTPNGQVLSLTSGLMIYLFDLKSGELKRSFDWKIGTITALAFSPDGLTAAAAAANQIVVWDLDD